MTDPVHSAVQDLISKMKEVQEFREKSFYVYDERVFLDASGPLSMPCAAVVYEGMISKGGSHMTGLAATQQFAILLINGNKKMDAKGKENKQITTDMLNRIRKCIRLTVAPGGHKWEFMMESPFELDTNHMGFIQRWRTTVVLTS
jgi:hypothetical protein